MKNKMTKEMMPATLVYAHIRYDELDDLANQNKNTKINDDLER